MEERWGRGKRGLEGPLKQDQGKTCTPQESGKDKEAEKSQGEGKDMLLPGPLPICPQPPGGEQDRNATGLLMGLLLKYGRVLIVGDFNFHVCCSHKSRTLSLLLTILILCSVSLTLHRNLGICLVWFLYLVLPLLL